TGLRARGDLRFKDKDFQGAIEAYTLLLQLREARPGALRSEKTAAYANRAACHMGLSDFGASVDDCHRALALQLKGTGSSADEVHAMVEQLVQDAGSCQQPQGEWGAGGAMRASLARLLARRATALGHLKRYKLAAQDYASSAKLQRNGGNAALAEQLESDLAVMLQMEQEHSSVNSEL
ncbi:hypothetical protein CYMTET_12655, partial [Cymbomonas tetramitiformis]